MTSWPMCCSAGSRDKTGGRHVEAHPDDDRQRCVLGAGGHAAAQEAAQVIATRRSARSRDGINHELCADRARLLPGFGPKGVLCSASTVDGGADADPRIVIASVGP